MKILISGSSGFVGQALCEKLKNEDHEVHRLLRCSEKISDNSVVWNPDLGEANQNEFENFDAFIHLGGAGIAEKRWSEKRKKILYDSRIHSTSLLSKIINSLKNPPQVFLCASAIGFYGTERFQELTEKSQGEEDFLGAMSKAWETAAQSAKTRVISMRFGIILNPSGGSLKKMLPVFKCCFGGKLGHGRQVMSWISLTDAIRAISFLLESNIEGAVNFTAPNPVSNIDFTKILAKTISRPTVFSVPTWVITFFLGEMGQDLLLSNLNVKPEVLLKNDFKFQYPLLINALKHELNKKCSEVSFQIDLI